MSKGKRFEDFEHGYREALSTIKRHQESENTMQPLVEWLLNTDANPYSFLSETWASGFSSAEVFAGFLNCLHHALYDDGDVEFVAVNGAPRIVFHWRNDEGFREAVLTEQEVDMEKRYGSEFTIEVLDCVPADFGVLYEEAQKKHIRKCFMLDAKRFGVDYAVSHYQTYSVFDDDWVEEFEDRVK